MNTTSTLAATNNNNGALPTIAKSAIVAGVLDAAAGVTVYLIFKGLNPIQVLQYIASGVLGASAFSGGILTAFAGLVLHFVIAFGFATAFFIVYPKIPLLAKNTVVTGLLYGLFIWLVMNLVVLPSSAVAKAPKNFVSIIEIAWHMALVGLPMAIITAKYYQQKNN